MCQVAAGYADALVVWPRAPPATPHRSGASLARLAKRRRGNQSATSPPRRGFHGGHAPPPGASTPPCPPHPFLPRSPPSRLLSTQQNTTATPIDLSSDESRRRLVNSLMYRSKQRGFLELDLVLGTWVEQHIRSMDEPNIRSLLQVLDIENPDLWKWLTGQEQAPEAVNSNPVFVAMKSKVTDNLSNHSSPETRSAPGQPWVRGWDDKRGLDGPKYGNQ